MIYIVDDARDIDLPDGSGLGLVAEIREMSLPMAVVALTGSHARELAVAPIRAASTCS